MLANTLFLEFFLFYFNLNKFVPFFPADHLEVIFVSVTAFYGRNTLCNSCGLKIAMENFAVENIITSIRIHFRGLLFFNEVF